MINKVLIVTPNSEFDENEKRILAQFIQSKLHQGIRNWKKDTVYTDDQGNMIFFHHDVIQIDRKSALDKKTNLPRQGIRLRFSTETSLGKGGFGEVVTYPGVIAIHNNSVV